MRRLLYNLHRIFGTLLCLLFAMWFASGLVMIYHRYPRATMAEQMSAAMPIGTTNDLPSRDSLLIMLHSRGLDTASITSMTIERESDKLQYTFGGDGICPVSIHPSGDTVQAPIINKPYLERLCYRWTGRDLARIDTIRHLNIWIINERNVADLPFYRISAEGDEGRWIYVSSRTGRVLSESTQSERIWASVGSVPHWLYIVSLRRHVDIWVWVLIIAGALGCVLVLSGLYVGIDIYLRTRRAKKKYFMGSPYKHLSYRWHHVSGILFGVFIFTWIFSGMMSVARLPSWITGGAKSYTTADIEGEPLPFTQFASDYREAIASVPEARRLQIKTFAAQPYYQIEAPGNTRRLSAHDLNPVQIPAHIVEDRVRTLVGPSPITMDTMDKSDGYYSLPPDGISPFPVYRIRIADQGRTTLYYSPQSLSLSLSNHGDRLNQIAYHKLHSLSFTFLPPRSAAWYIVMWILLLGGTIVSLSGVWLGVRYLRRGWRRIKPTKPRI